MARGPRWVPLRPVAVPSHGTPHTATSTPPARRSAGVRQTGSFMKVWMPLQAISPGRLTTTGPGVRAGCGPDNRSDTDPRIRDGLQDVHGRVDHDVAGAEQEGHAGDRGKVRDWDALCDVLAKAGPGENLFDHENPGEHQADLQSRHGHR